MPSKPKKPCAQFGCPNLTTERYCETHRQQARQYDKQRGSAASRGYDRRWQNARRVFLMKHPLCVECEKEKKLVPATVVDHIVPHKGNQELFWDEDNWQPLCKSCHDSKTAREDGGFGNGSFGIF
ncbi:HNH endonuclease signature motif containing protein [Aneurinibacillus thermoaerophilus]|uniref:HNH endonuclease signature motif containing protein n=1 Tax=Aneurinibacillus thermoaerophilus TaxID=143495 RepID=UPI002E21C114|nr:HNH endonuclease signature motif containing protein [Aneurinibacillus thermoaerophilus]